MYEHNALGYWSGLALCLTKIGSSRARCPATALIVFCPRLMFMFDSFTSLTINCSLSPPSSEYFSWDHFCGNLKVFRSSVYPA